ncbi:hypothetical protein [Nocardia sp. NPDC052566]|uniref:hypothetical protein n=1 Tax=Nocardia sp. NPDC052566 TaxID=3364330 RepID=UPI0037CA7FAA
MIMMMVEERPYFVDSATLEEDCRRKMNTYISALRSGYVRQLAADRGISETAGIEIVLFSSTEPTAMVKEMIELVNSELADERVTARWESWAPDVVDSEVVERALVTEAIGSVGAGWEFALVWANLRGQPGFRWDSGGRTTRKMPRRH